MLKITRDELFKKIEEKSKQRDPCESKIYKDLKQKLQSTKNV